MKKILIFASLVSMFSLCNGNEASASAASFSDVPAASPFVSYINDLARLGVTDGIAPGQFGPVKTLTRAQFAKFVAVAYQMNDSGTSMPFLDLQGHWAAPNVNALYQAGIIDGTSDTTFSPEQPVKREEAAAMIWRLAVKKGISTPGLVKFQVQPDAWAVDGISGVLSKGWYAADASQSSGKWSYRPRDNMTRQEMAALLALSMRDLPGSIWTAASPATESDKNAALSSWQQTLKEHLLQQDTAFDVTIDDPAAFNQIKDFSEKLMADHDYLHYVYHAMKYKYDGISTVTFNVTYLESKTQSDYVAEQAKTIVDSIISPGMNDFEKEKAIHDYVISHLAYDRTLSDHTAYGGLTKGTTVCQGYALLTYQLLTEAGIPNKIAEGRAGGELHTWNIVQLDGDWYHLDTTWDDPVPDVKGRLSYHYFNLTDDQIRHDHSWTGNYPTANNDFIQTVTQQVQAGKMDEAVSRTLLGSTGLSAESAADTGNTIAELQTILKRELTAKHSPIVVKYKSSLGSASTVMKAALTNKMMQEYGVAKVQYGYGADTRLAGYTLVTVDVNYG